MVPFIVSCLVERFSIPKAIVLNRPPTNPPIWAALSMSGIMNPMSKFRAIIGIICVFSALSKYNL